MSTKNSALVAGSKKSGQVSIEMLRETNVDGKRVKVGDIVTCSRMVALTLLNIPGTAKEATQKPAQEPRPKRAKSSD